MDNPATCRVCREPLIGFRGDGVCEKCCFKEALKHQSPNEPFAEELERNEVCVMPQARTQETISNAGTDAHWMLGNHRIIEQIGHGGNAVVYLAHEEAMQRIVALKVIMPSEGVVLWKTSRTSQ